MSSPERSAAAAVIVAGGAGRRFGGELPKQFVELAGEPILLRAIRPFLQHPEIGSVTVVLPAEFVSRPPGWLAALSVTRVAGGAERSDSVRRGLEATPEDAAVVLIHDGARPLIDPELIGRVLAASREGAAIPGIPVTDTLKEVDASGSVRGTPDRSRFLRAQTPQGFPRATILEAHRRALREGTVSTDDASLCEALGVPVRVVPGSPANLKVTDPIDLVVAEALLRCLPVPEAPPMLRGEPPYPPRSP